MSKRQDSERTKESGTIVGLFHNQIDAEQAIQRLKEADFSEDQIGVAMRDRDRQQKLVEDTGTQVAEGAAAGALGGGILGGVLGLLTGVGALAIPGVGPIIAGGTLASTLAGAGIGAAAGGLLGALVGMGIPEEDARHFDQGFRAGGILVTVNAGTRADEARECLYESGADLGSMSRGTAGSKMSTTAAAAERMPGAAEGAQRVELDEDARVPRESESWRGNERRYRHDANYSGPERRVAEV
jgi:hypothetical protein